MFEFLFVISEKPRIAGGKEEFVFVTTKNENAVLRCAAKGFPPPITIWYFNGQLVQDGAENRFIGYDGRLILTKVKKISPLFGCISHYCR